MAQVSGESYLRSSKGCQAHGQQKGSDGVDLHFDFVRRESLETDPWKSVEKSLELLRLQELVKARRVELHQAFYIQATQTTKAIHLQ